MSAFKSHLGQRTAADLASADLSSLVNSTLPAKAGHFWGGAWHAGGHHLFSQNPSTELPLGEFALGGRAEIDAAVQSAHRAFPLWSSTPPLERAQRLRLAASIVRDHALELALLDAADCGNPVKAMQMDSEIAAFQLEYFAGLVLENKGETLPTGNGSLNYSLREPLGVVGRIFPFNHPFMFAAGKMAAPLAAGNTVVLKPPEQAPLSTLRLMELLEPVFPPGVLNTVTGGREAGEALASHPLVAAVGLIGSIPAGQAVLRASAGNLKRTLLELGGKNAMVVYPDADFQAAVDGAVRGMNFTWCGQSCGSTSRLLIHDSLYDAFIDSLVSLLPTRHKPGIATHMDSTMGALVNQVQYDRSMHYIRTAHAEGAKLVIGGGRPSNMARGFFIEPTVFKDVQPHHRLAQEEVFGPVLGVMRWRDEEDMLKIVNGLSMGLTASVWTRDLVTAHRAAMRIQAGYVWINDASIHLPGAAFGGYKQSGLGREESFQELHEFTQIKNINVSLRGSRP